MAAIVGLATGVCLSFFAPAHGHIPDELPDLLGRVRWGRRDLIRRHMKKDDVWNCCRVALHRGARHLALDNGSRFKDRVCARGAPYFGRAGAEISRYLLTAEERHFVEPGGGKSSLFGERGPNEY